MRADTLRVGVIGLGLVSRPHLDGYEQAEGCELVAVCDVSQKKVDAVTRERGVTGATDHMTILDDPDVDAVALLLPHRLHHEVARAALERGKHVCIEKPITVTEGEADDLIALASERGLALAVAENTRYVRAYVAAERLVRSGELGEIRMVRGFIADQILDEWADTDDTTQAWKREPHGCGAIMDCAPHMLYLLTWFWGGVETLYAIAQGWVPSVPLDNHGIVAGKLEAGPFFSIELCSLTEYPRGERLEIFGSAGTLIIDQVLDPPAVLYRGAEDLDGTPLDDVPYDIRGWKAESIRATAIDFVEAVRDGREPSVTAADSRYVVRLVERAYESAARGGAALSGHAS